MSAELGETWHVRRTGGALVPGFRKRFSEDGRLGMTYLGPLPIGRFDVVAPDAAEPVVELRYRRWPVVDVLDRAPGKPGSIDATGNVWVGSRRLRFCRFRLER